jgi:hypothetical protein
VSGRATIVAIAPTGATFEDNPELELELSVSVPGREPYRATHRQVVSRLVMHHLEPGSAVPVHVDAAFPDRLRIG